MPELERLMLHRLAELDALVRQAYAEFDYKRIFAALNAFMTVDLSAFYFDIRKDALYCDPISSLTRKACLTVLDQLFRCTVTWLAPMLCFTAEEAWLVALSGARTARCICEPFPDMPAAWRDDALAEKWRKVRTVRRVVTGALELERAAKRIGSSLEAAPVVYVSDPDLFAALVDDRPRRGLRSRPPRRWSRARGRPTRSGFAEWRASRSCRASPRARSARAPGKSRRRRLRSGLSRRHAARRAGAARMGRACRRRRSERAAPTSAARSPASG